MSTFYSNFIKMCNITGCTPSRAANECGIGKSTVTSWKKKECIPTDANISKLCDFFNCEKWHLMDEDGAESFQRYINGLTDIYGFQRKGISSVIDFMKEEPTGDQIDSDEFNDMPDDELDSFIRELVSKRGNNFKVKLASGILGSVTNE